MKELLKQLGFLFHHVCRICKNEYDVFTNAAKPNVEVKVARGKDYFKIYISNQQVGYGNASQLQSKLEKL